VPALCSLPPRPPCFPPPPSLPLPSLQSSASIAATLLPGRLIIPIVPTSPCAWVRDCPLSLFPPSRFLYPFLVSVAPCVPLPPLLHHPPFRPHPVPSRPRSDSADLADSVGSEGSRATPAETCALPFSCLPPPPGPTEISLGLRPLRASFARDGGRIRRTSDGDHRALYAIPIIRKHEGALRLSCLSELRRQLATRKRVADNEPLG